MIDEATFGGYLQKHNRPPAFEGADGEAYSASVYVDGEPDARGLYGAAIVFVQWSRAGDRPVGHVETPFLAYGATSEEASTEVMTLSLRRLKELLDEAVMTSRDRPDW